MPPGSVGLGIAAPEQHAYPATLHSRRIGKCFVGRVRATVHGFPLLPDFHLLLILPHAAAARRWMYKATKRGRWKRRFFILAPGPDPATSAWLTYYTGEGNRSARGFIPLGDVSSLACVGEGHKLLLFTPQRLWRLQPSDVAQSAGLLQALRPVVQAEASVLAQGWASKLPRSKFGRAVSVGNPWRRCVASVEGWRGVRARAGACVGVLLGARVCADRTVPALTSPLPPRTAAT